MKKYRKILLTIILSLIVLSSQVYALSDILDDGKDFINDGKDKATTTVAADRIDTLDTSELQDGSDDIFNMLLAVGTVVVVIVGAVLGIQFMTAGIDKKVDVKQALFPYLISSIIMFSAFAIWDLIITIMKDITS